MAYKLNTMGGMYFLPDLKPAEARVPSVVGTMLELARHGMYVNTGVMDRTIYLSCESLSAEPPLGDEWGT